MNTKLVAEFGCNHQGEFVIAMQMIDEAAKLGIWAVKNQKRDVEAFSEGLKLLPRDPKNSFGPNYYEHRKALEFTPEQHAELKEYAEDQGLKYVVSVFDPVSARQMDDVGVEYVKLPSQLYTNFHMCRLLINMKKHREFTFMTSVGMHTESEVEEWQYREEFDVIFYCRSIYPAEADQLDLSKMIPLRQSLGLHQRLGYSSHDRIGVGIPVAVALGAEIVERHFTLDKNWKGSDHGTVSSDVAEFKNIIESVERVEELLGSYNHDLIQAEVDVRKVYRGF